MSDPRYPPADGDDRPPDDRAAPYDSGYQPIEDVPHTDASLADTPDDFAYPPPPPPRRPPARNERSPWPMIIGVTLLAILAGVMAFLVLGGEGDADPSPSASASASASAAPSASGRAQCPGIGRGLGIGCGQRRVLPDRAGDRLDRGHERGRAVGARGTRHRRDAAWQPRLRDARRSSSPARPAPTATSGTSSPASGYHRTPDARDRSRPIRSTVRSGSDGSPPRASTACPG